jgi:hypothetical protein
MVLQIAGQERGNSARQQRDQHGGPEDELDWLHVRTSTAGVYLRGYAGLPELLLGLTDYFVFYCGDPTMVKI